MFELIAIAIAILGGFVAGLWDLKTTDIPDEAPALMAVLGLFLWYVSGMTTGDWTPFITSAILGTVVFAGGWALYKAGQWGGGDAALLAGIFYLVPNITQLADFIFDFFIVALGYLIVYSISLGVLNPKVFGYTFGEIKQRKLTPLLVWIALNILALVPLSGMGTKYALIGWLTLAIASVILFYVYAKVVERRLFKRVIPVSKLKVGDVLADSKRWEGITAEQITELARKHKTIAVKEGVRFGLVFPIALIVSLLLGNILYWFAGMF